MKIDDQGKLVLSSSKADNVRSPFQLLRSRSPTYQDYGRIPKLPQNDIPYLTSTRLTSLIKIGKNFQIVRLLPTQQLYQTYIVPGVILDFKDGGTLQTACEHPSAQAELLKGMRLLLLTAIAQWLECPQSPN